jgi:ribulose-5-phosphate 4-epimerase/fuculose-1-phosphate aldolase
VTLGDIRAQVVACGRSLFARGYSPGTSGNLSARLEDGRVIVTPTNVSLGDLDESALSEVDGSGVHRSGPAPTKEVWLHLAMYRGRPQDRAIVHLHSTYATALSCRTDLDPADMLPPLTPYVVMRVGTVPLVGYHPPGSDDAAVDVEALARRHRAVLLANHGPVVSAGDIVAASAAAEELEQTAKLFFLLEARPHARLSVDQVRELQRRFGG